MDRRTLLAGLAVLPAAGRAAGMARLAVLDWGLVQTCLALGRVPIGVPAPPWYDRYAGEPLLPPGVTDVGLLFTPNFELLQELAPDAIVIPPALGLVRALLGRIAPVIIGAIFRPVPGNTYAFAREGTRRLAGELGLDASFSELEARVEAAFAAAREALNGYDGRPVFLLTVLDGRHVIVFGAASIHQEVLARLGLRNAWDGATRGEFATVGVDALAGIPNARIVAITPGGGGRMAAMARNPLWAALSPVREGRVHIIDPVLGSGGLPAAARLARLLGRALAGEDG